MGDEHLYQLFRQWSAMPLIKAMAEIRAYEKATGYAVEYSVEPTMDGRTMLVIHRLVRWPDEDLTP